MNNERPDQNPQGTQAGETPSMTPQRIDSLLAVYRDGLLDDVSLWNIALDAEAVREIYENGLSGISVVSSGRAFPQPPRLGAAW